MCNHYACVCNITMGYRYMCMPNYGIYVHVNASNYGIYVHVCSRLTMGYTCTCMPDYGLYVHVYNYGIYVRILTMRYMCMCMYLNHQIYVRNYGTCVCILSTLLWVTVKPAYSDHAPLGHKNVERCVLWSLGQVHCTILIMYM